MKKLDRYARERFVCELAEAQTAYSENQFGKAKSLFLAAWEKALEYGVRSSEIAMYIAICADLSNDAATATRFVKESLALDPLSGRAIHTEDVLCNRFRTRLAEWNGDFSDGEIETIYRLLVVELNRPDETSHITYCKHLLATNRAREAFDLARAVCRTNPSVAEAWALLAVAARACGEDAVAAQAETEKAILDGTITLTVAAKVRATA